LTAVKAACDCLAIIIRGSKPKEFLVILGLAAIAIPPITTLAVEILMAGFFSSAESLV
jgi:orotate phosphoribosyltransferase